MFRFICLAFLSVLLLSLPCGAFVSAPHKHFSRACALRRGAGGAGGLALPGRAGLAPRRRAAARAGRSCA